MKNFLLPLGLSISFLHFVGCGAAYVDGPPAVAVQSLTTQNKASTDDTLGSIDGEPVRRGDLRPKLTQQLKDIENEALQRQLHLLWVGVEDIMGDKLIAREAQKRGISVDDLLEVEVNSKASPPTDEEVRNFFDANRYMIKVSYDAASPFLREKLLTDKREEQRRALIDRLRKDADIRYTLDVPPLPRYKVDAGKNPELGPRDATVTLVEFSDFQCPYCAQARRMIARLVELYPKSLRVVFRDFPLAQHNNAKGAAEAAFCANEQSKFWAYHDILFENANALEVADLKRYAKDAELNMSDFEKCLSSDRPKTALAEDERAADNFGVQGTPAIFINGMKLVGLLPLPLMQILIEQEMQK